jgi:hypothetical protein
VTHGDFSSTVPQFSRLLVDVDPVQHGRVVGDGADEAQMALFARVFEVVSAETVALDGKVWEI